MSQPTQPSSAQVAPPKFTFEQLLNSEKFQRQVAQVLPKHMTPQRVVQTALNAMNRNPDLRLCTQASFFAALMRLSEIGLEPDGYHAHLIPFNQRIKGSNDYEKVVQLIVDYKGLVTVIRRNPAIAVVKGAVVYDGDLFEYEEGSQRIFRHKPAFLSEQIIGAYSFIKFAQIDDWEVDYQPLWRIEKVRAISRAKDKGPWVDNYDEMCIKTVLRHHAKTLPLRPEERMAVQADDDQFEFNPFGPKPLPVRPAQIGAGSKKEEGSPPEPPPEPPEPQSVVEPPGPHLGGGAAPQEPADPQHSEKADNSPPPELQLERLVASTDLQQMEVINALIEHKIGVDDAGESGAIVDLPEAAILAALHGWDKIVFTVNKQRLAKKK
jgi:recombination protein RecT